jgi:hypothetical protein
LKTNDSHIFSKHFLFNKQLASSNNIKQIIFDKVDNVGKSCEISTDESHEAIAIILHEFRNFIRRAFVKTRHLMLFLLLPSGLHHYILFVCLTVLLSPYPPIPFP